MPIFDKFPTFSMFWMKIDIFTQFDQIFYFPTLDPAKYFYKMAATLTVAAVKWV